MMHDSDIDTCLPGDVEKHCDDNGPNQAVDYERSSKSGVGQKRKRVEALTGSSCGSARSPRVRAASPIAIQNGGESDAIRLRLLAANALTKMAAMTGRAMEAFNKSIKHRVLDCKYRSPLLKTADIIQQMRDCAFERMRIVGGMTWGWIARR